ncbi:hypothetical protein F511_44986 [Dorcoceras hygrometricum]|uniref:Uncharacterized protein n=1 Tax=Dorcoceras hygrometricum TaxID=472368 RepID=A0A2Z7D687_9LAMI|nr:hypothetical protein F511_44986 [Dorcoceras hygrometricum]
MHNMQMIKHKASFIASFVLEVNSNSSVIIFVKLMAQKLYLGPIALDRMTTDISFNVVKYHPI